MTTCFPHARPVAKLPQTGLDMRQNYYEIVRDVLAHNIVIGKLPPGMRLFAAAVAERLGVSRPPAKRAMELLKQEGLLSALPGQGYCVGSADFNTALVRENLHLLDLDLSMMDSLKSTSLAPRWGQVHEELKDQLLKVIPFGKFQISESAVAEAFGVSRTVAHEALARLDSEGLVGKSRSSHWTAGPLSVQMLDDAHAVRILLEPAALQQVTHNLPRAELMNMRTVLRNAANEGPALSPPRLMELERALHITCLETLRNRPMLEILIRLQLDHIVNDSFRKYVTTPDDRDMIAEHSLVVDHLLLGDAEGAAAALRYHLNEDHVRTRSRLKVLSLFEDSKMPLWLSPSN